MTLADERLKGLDDPSLTSDERALWRCRAAADLIHRGQYEAAAGVLGDFWRGPGRRPDVEGLAERTAAEVLLQAGSLSGWVGARQQAGGAQEAAKDLLSESAAHFERLGETTKAAYARSDLALCYWREGGYDEARILLTRALEGLGDVDPERRATVLLRLVTVECAAGSLRNALDGLKECERLLCDSENHVLRGSLHNLHAVTLRRLGALERLGDHYDRAIIEYTAAIHHYEQGGNERYAASIENNLAFLLYKLGRYADAHEHLDRAGAAFVRLRDLGRLAQLDETRARLLLAEGRYVEAGRVIAGAVKTLERGGELALLADALTVQGVARARLGDCEGSLDVLRRAVSVAEEAGALSNAALAALTLIEEHGAGGALAEGELYELYRRADRLLEGGQDAAEAARLRDCARVVMGRLAGAQPGDGKFTLFGAVQELEARCIERALEEAGGSVTRAAKLLGVHHQTLTSMLRTRHRRLQSRRTPPERRLRSIIKKEG